MPSVPSDCVRLTGVQGNRIPSNGDRPGPDKSRQLRKAIIVESSKAREPFPAHPGIEKPTSCVEVWTTIPKQIIARVEAFAARLVQVHAHYFGLFQGTGSSVQNPSPRIDNLRLPDVTESPFPADSVAGDGEYAVLQTPRTHCLRAIGKHQIRG